MQYCAFTRIARGPVQELVRCLPHRCTFSTAFAVLSADKKVEAENERLRKENANLQARLAQVMAKSASVMVSRDEWYGKRAGSPLPTRVTKDGDVDLAAMRKDNEKDIRELPEIVQLNRFLDELDQGLCKAPAGTSLSLVDVGMAKEECRTALTSGFATMVSHVEARISAFVGQGFYTIGPGGEELLSAVGLVLRESDAVALHYRHLATQMARHMRYKSLDDILMDRARGHVVSSLDPVGGGVHCSLGGGEFDYIVTSTLASQAPPAVGRALGGGLANFLLKGKGKFTPDFVSYVSVGDGSVNNAHFLAAINMAEYASFRSYKCPIVFGISDNDICISLRGHGFLGKFFSEKLKMPVYKCDGSNLADVYRATKEAVAYARKEARPVALIFSNLPRRFGHAATDRQAAYLSAEEIARAQQRNPLAGACAQAVEAGFATYPELARELRSVWEKTRHAFDKAVREPKITSRQVMLDRVSQPLVDVPSAPAAAEEEKKSKSSTAVMRKHMNGVIDEILTKEKNSVYVGEDVEHGGYYLVTEGLAKKFPMRVRDFPPDETSLLGMGIGFSQAGLLPIVEMPYAKYLDCGFDMFTEVAVGNWLSGGKRPNGMMIRLQGFGQGVFGGNYHTHNMLHILPGVDVVCYSNGYDYARGWRYAMEQVKAGRVVMSVDCTNLLNLRHVHDGDDKWRRPYPQAGQVLAFDDVIRYGDDKDTTAIVTYGNGVVTALKARDFLVQEYGVTEGISVIDSPYLSRASQGLKDVLARVNRVVFVDNCKLGTHPFGGIISELQHECLLPARWDCVTAPPTYNPLGNTITFVNEADIVESCLKVIQ